MKYFVIGGNPFRMYTGTTTFTGLSLLGTYDNKEDVKKNISNHYDEASGLVMVLTSDGEVVSHEF